MMMVTMMMRGGDDDDDDDDDRDDDDDDDQGKDESRSRSGNSSLRAFSLSFECWPIRYLRLSSAKSE